MNQEPVKSMYDRSQKPITNSLSNETESFRRMTVPNDITTKFLQIHPIQTAFLSSVDLYTHLSYQMLMQKAIAIVISPKFHETAIFSLTSNTGIPIISTCQQLSVICGFLQISSHTTYDIGLQCKIVDLRV
ncbi:unnamed protein product [Adineta ricciae]|uniref:Uncharacterized protein n=1 Tax=Adineta ricciae TaxID=249248 RepID=A0A814GN49_ADIRI|nr:unnamed protein product [Adineta ricciae]